MYDRLSDRLGTRQTRKISNHTYLERLDADTIAVRLHDTHIVTVTRNASGLECARLNTGGYQTDKTFREMSDALIGSGITLTRHIASKREADNGIFDARSEDDAHMSIWNGSDMRASDNPWAVQRYFKRLEQEQRKYWTVSVPGGSPVRFDGRLTVICTWLEQEQAA